MTACPACVALHGKGETAPHHASLQLRRRRRSDAGMVLVFHCTACDAEMDCHLMRKATGHGGWRLGTRGGLDFLPYRQDHVRIPAPHAVEALA